MMLTRHLRVLCARTLVLFSVAGSSPLVAEESLAKVTWPSAKLKAGGVEMDIYLPDAKEGFYRASRFDWSGIIASLRWDGAEFFGPWRASSRHDPLGGDAVVGPAEEYGMTNPLGYDEAAVGGEFLKIGVGHLRKAKDKPYWFAEPMEIVEALPWEVSQTENSIRFIQHGALPSGLGYRYEKEIQLREQPPGFVISRRLQNTGTKPWRSDHYNHNFVVFDGRPVNTATRVEVPFQVADAKTFDGIGEVSGNGVRFTGELPQNKGLYAILREGGLTVADHAAEFTNSASNTGIRLRGDHAPTKMVFYAIGRSVCVEPFLDFELKPGESAAWTTSYEVFRPASGTGSPTKE